MAGVVVATLSVGAAIDQFWGRPWPTDPEIHPHEIATDSSQVLPFTVRNKSFFDMKDVEFRCGIDLVWGEDAKGQQILIRDMAFKEGVYSISSDPINYPCKAVDLLKIRPDGSLSLYGSSTELQSSPPKKYQEPWRIKKMCVWIRGDYKFANLIPVNFTSVIFQWPAEPTIHHWIEGPIARQPPKEEQLPGAFPDALQCSPTVRFPYGMTVDSGRQILVFK